MVDVTLKQGIEKTLREKVPGVTAVRDATDHDTGEAPYIARGSARRNSVANGRRLTFSSAELTDALRRRRRRSLRPARPAGQFPPRWRAWERGSARCRERG